MKVLVNEIEKVDLTDIAKDTFDDKVNTFVEKEKKKYIRWQICTIFI